MAVVSSSLFHGVQALSDADQLRMPGYDTRFAAGMLPATDRPGERGSRGRIDPRAWLAALRRPVAQVSR